MTPNKSLLAPSFVIATELVPARMMVFLETLPSAPYVRIVVLTCFACLSLFPSLRQIMTRAPFSKSSAQRMSSRDHVFRKTPSYLSSPSCWCVFLIGSLPTSFVQRQLQLSSLHLPLRSLTHLPCCFFAFSACMMNLLSNLYIYIYIYVLILSSGYTSKTALIASCITCRIKATLNLLSGKNSSVCLYWRSCTALKAVMREVLARHYAATRLATGSTSSNSIPQ